MTIELCDKSQLRWVQPTSTRRAYQLRAENEVVGWLEFQKQRGTLAIAEVQGNSWTFKREGVLRPRITVRAAGSEKNIATFELNWRGGGMLQMADGPALHWDCANFWGSEWSFSLPNGAALLRFRLEFGWMKPSARLLSLNREATVFPALDLLMALAWYLMVLAAEDMVGSTAIAAMG